MISFGPQSEQTKKRGPNFENSMKRYHKFGERTRGLYYLTHVTLSQPGVVVGSLVFIHLIPRVDHKILRGNKQTQSSKKVKIRGKQCHTKTMIGLIKS